MDKRNITKTGVKYKTKKYWADFMDEHQGKQVLVELQDKHHIKVYLGSTLLGTATEIGYEDKISKGSDKMFGLGKKLKDYKDEELIKELVRRHGVSVLKIRDDQQYQVKGNGSRIKEWGPATVFVIRD